MIYNSKYAHDFKYWVWKFIDDKKLLFPKRDLVLLCSGGADSLALLITIAHGLNSYEKYLNVVYFHHGTRSVDEHNFDIETILSVINALSPNVRKWIVFHKISLNDLALNGADFENSARLMRKSELKKRFSSKEHYYLTGHHIDDSFEWWFKGRLTQSHARKPIGIPLINGSYRRPFHCVTKNHILKFLKSIEVVHAEDSSNTDTKFERNFLRSEVISAIKKRYPKYLKHFVNQRNHELAETNCVLNFTKSNPRIYEVKIAHDLVYFSVKDESFFQQDLENIFKKYSPVQKGFFNKSLIHFYGKKNSKLNQPKLKGPLSFSGGLHLWQWKHHFFLWISKTRPNHSLDKLDQLLLSRMSDIHSSENFSADESASLAKLFESLGIVKISQLKKQKKITDIPSFFKVLCPKFYHYFLS